MGGEGRRWDPRGGRGKVLAGGALIVAAVIYLIASSTYAGAQYYLTLDEMLAQAEHLRGKTLRISGAVDGDSIAYDPQSQTLRFTLAGIPGDMEDINRSGGLAAVLKHALSDPAAARVVVLYQGAPPDLLRHEAQAIVTGRLGEDGVFYADDLLLKCPTRYREEIPAQAVGE